MAGLGSVVVQFLGKDRMSGAVKDITRSLGGLNSKTGESESAVTRFGKVAGAALFGVVGVAVAAGAAFVDMAHEALEDKESADRLARTLESLKGVTKANIAANEEWISSMQLATNVSDTDLRVAVSKLSLATGDLTEAQDLVKIALDAAAGSGKSLSAVTDALAKAANGNTGALKRMFPWLDKNHDGTVTLKESVDGLRGAYKGAAAEAAKTKPWETLGTIFGELREAVGSALIPILTKLSDWFSKKENQAAVQRFIDKVTALATQVGEQLVPKLRELYNWLKDPKHQKSLRDFAEDLATVASAVASLIGFLSRVVGWLRQVWTWMDKINRLTDVFQLLPSGMRPGASSASAAPAGVGVSAYGVRTATAAPPGPAPVVNVTEEQIYRAVARLMLRGDARNGHRPRVA